MPRNGSLLFSIEQWELIRRLRNSGLTKEQIGQAFDDLTKIEQDLGSMYNIPTNLVNNPASANFQANAQINQISHLSGNDQKFANNQILSNMQIFQMAKNLTSMNRSTASSGQGSNSNGLNFQNLNGNSNSVIPQASHKAEATNEHFTSAPNGSHSQSNGQTTAAVTIVNNHFASLMEPDQEAKQIEEFKLKGEVVIHGEISFFVYKHDLKQSQIARMAGVNQAYVSKFLRGEFFDLSENGKSLIYKWYLRYLKNATIFHQAHNITLNPNISNSTNGQHHQLNSHDKVIVKSETAPNFQSLSNLMNTYETPKRSRFSFKSEHLLILEKAFIENQYPDQKKREELAKQCNELKTGPERVTEQIITHWFQNKRKIIRKANADDQASISPREGVQTNHSQNGDYHDDNLSFHEDFRGDSNGQIDNEYQNESSIEYQEFIDEDADYHQNQMLDQQQHNNRNNNRKRSTDSIDY